MTAMDQQEAGVPWAISTYHVDGWIFIIDRDGGFVAKTRRSAANHLRIQLIIDAVNDRFGFRPPS